MPSYDVINEYRTVFVVFQESSYSRFWRCWCEPGFVHCWAFHEKPTESQGLMTHQWTQVFDPLGRFINCDFWFMDPQDVKAHYIQEPMVSDVVRINILYQTDGGVTFRGVGSCVSLIKAYLNIKAWWVLTPRQLWYYLLRNNGVSLKLKKRG